MEMYVMAAGQMDNLHRWVQDLNSLFLPTFDKDGNQKKERRRLLVAPVQLYKFAFAKQNLDMVTECVCPHKDYVQERYDLGFMGKMIRKKLGLKKCSVPEKINPYTQPNPYDKAVAVMPLGIKEDMTCKETGEEMI